MNFDIPRGHDVFILYVYGMISRLSLFFVGSQGFGGGRGDGDRDGLNCIDRLGFNELSNHIPIAKHQNQEP